MSTYTKSINEHPIHDSLTQVNSMVSVVKGMEDMPSEDIENILRAEFVLNNFSEAIKLAEKQLIAISWLAESSSALNNINSYLSSYNSNRNAAYLTTNMNPQLDIILSNTVKINTVKSKSNLQGIMSSIEKYQNSISDYLKSIENRNSNLKNTEDGFLEKVEELDASLKKKSVDFEATINQEKTRLDNLITNHQTQIAANKSEFQDQQKVFSDKFDASQSEFKKSYVEQKNEFETQIESLVDALNQTKTDFNTKSEGLINENKKSFDKYQDEVKNIVGIVNTNMFSHKYKEVADDAHKRAKFWHGAAIALMVLLAAFAFYSFVITLNQDTSWVKLVAKIFAATTVATGAAYAARQASKQEKVERYARKTEMEMVAIDPFLESLTDEQRQEVKQEIARTIFGKSDSMEITTKDEAHTALDKFSNADEILNAVIKLVGKIK